MMESTPTYNFTINQGTDVTVPILLTDADDQPIDLSGYSARMQLRTSVYSDTAVDTLTTENERIEIVALEGKLTLSFPNAITEEYPAQTLVYDIEIQSSQNQVTRILSGKISVSAEVTRVVS